MTTPDQTPFLGYRTQRIKKPPTPISTNNNILMPSLKKEKVKVLDTKVEKVKVDPELVSK